MGLIQVLWEPKTGVFLIGALRPTTVKFHQEKVHVFLSHPTSPPLIFVLHSQSPAQCLVQYEMTLIYTEWIKSKSSSRWQSKLMMVPNSLIHLATWVCVLFTLRLKNSAKIFSARNSPNSVRASEMTPQGSNQSNLWCGTSLQNQNLNLTDKSMPWDLKRIRKRRRRGRKRVVEQKRFKDKTTSAKTAPLLGFWATKRQTEGIWEK